MGKHIQENDLKTVNGQSLLGEGDLNIEGGGSSIELNDEQFYKGEDGKYKVGYTYTVGDESVKVDGFKNLNSTKGLDGAVIFGNFYDVLLNTVSLGSFLTLSDAPTSKAAQAYLGCVGYSSSFVKEAIQSNMQLNADTDSATFGLACRHKDAGADFSLYGSKSGDIARLDIVVGTELSTPSSPTRKSTTIAVVKDITTVKSTTRLVKSRLDMPPLMIPSDSLTTTPKDGSIERGEDGRLYTSYGGGRHKLVEEQDLDTKVEELTAIIADLQKQIEELKK